MSEDVLLSRYKEASHRTIAGEQYKGLVIHAKPGLHAHVATLIQRHLPAGSHLAELAAGSGAMSLRLADLGYRITSVDAVEENFRLKDSIPFRKTDLNGDFACELPKVDAVVAVEIIEHLENPRHFMRQIFQLLSPGGLAFVTTPNIGNPVSRAIYLREGRFQWFMKQHYASEGHITPVPSWLLNDAARESGLTVLDIGSFGDPFPHVQRWPSVRLLGALAARVLKIDQPAGEILTAILQRPQNSNQ